MIKYYFSILMMFFTSSVFANVWDSVCQIQVLNPVASIGTNIGSGVVVGENNETYKVLTAGHLINKDVSNQTYVAIFHDGLTVTSYIMKIEKLSNDMDWALLSFKKDSKVHVIAKYKKEDGILKKGEKYSLLSFNPEDGLNLKKLIYLGPKNKEALFRGYSIGGNSGGAIFTNDATLVGILSSYNKAGFIIGVPLSEIVEVSTPEPH